MSAYDEERLAELLRAFPPPPPGLVEAASSAGSPADVVGHGIQIRAPEEPRRAAAARVRSVSPDRLLDARLRDFLSEIAGKKPTPGAGSVAAVAVAMAAGLLEMAARNSEQWAEAPGAVAQAQALRARAVVLAEAVSQAYEDALAALRSAKELGAGERDAALADTLRRAAAPPLQVAETSVDVAELAALVAERGDANVRADAVGAAALAEGAVRAVAHLVEINLAVTQGDERLQYARDLVEAASAAARRALAQ